MVVRWAGVALLSMPPIGSLLHVSASAVGSGSTRRQSAVVGGGTDRPQPTKSIIPRVSVRVSQSAAESVLHVA